jgi:hypothetical protein
MAGRFRLVVSERIKLIRAVEKSLDWRAGDHGIRSGQQHRLAHLMVPGPHPDHECLLIDGDAPGIMPRCREPPLGAQPV